MGLVWALISGASFGMSNVMARKGAAIDRLGEDSGILISLTVNNVINGLLVLFLLAAGTANRGFSWVGVVWFLVAGVLTSFLGRRTLFGSIRRIGAARAGTLKVTAPVFTALVGFFILKEEVSGLGWVLVALILLGIYVVAREAGTGAVPEAEDEVLEGLRQDGPGRLRHLSGTAMGIGAGVLFGLGYVARKIGITIYPNAVLGAMLGSASALAAALLLGVFTGAVRGLQGQSLGKLFGSGYGLAGIFTSLGMISILLSLGSTPVATANAVASTESLFSIVGARFLLRKKETLTWRLILGASMVVAGVGTLLTHGG